MDEPLFFDDETLARAGLVRTAAYVRSEKSKKALREERHRKKREAAGTRQINVETPDTEEARDALRSVAAAMRQGAVAAAAVAEFVERERNAPLDVPPAQAAATDPLADDLARVRQILMAGGWRARAVRWLAGRGVGAAKS